MKQLRTLDRKVKNYGLPCNQVRGARVNNFLSITFELKNKQVIHNNNTKNYRKEN